MSHDAILGVRPLGFPWETDDPFLFCVHHLDAYPAGNEKLGPAASLEGRNLGMDFEGKDGWRMYHGDIVPGFPQHPHRGFETVTLARRGYIDHSDSLGAQARFGHGDVQWMTAGKGVVHSEMFPLLEPGEPNTVELFQIWLNLPRSDKLVDPHFAMLWGSDIPEVDLTDDAGRATKLRIVAGRLGDAVAPPPPPSSWAARSNSHVAIWTLVLEPEARLRLPAAVSGLNRTLYFFEGESMTIAGRQFTSHAGVRVKSDAELTIENGPSRSEVLMLQGRPIGEPVVQYGPFVMNTRTEIQQAVTDYQRTRFGGWPWPSDEPVHGKDTKRFARHADGRVEDGR
jgi:redox-sensitive bicupin YhaK (pirin superfamily)